MPLVLLLHMLLYVLSLYPMSGIYCVFPVLGSSSKQKEAKPMPGGACILVGQSDEGQKELRVICSVS